MTHDRTPGPPNASVPADHGSAGTSAGSDSPRTAVSPEAVRRRWPERLWREWFPGTHGLALDPAYSARTIDLLASLEILAALLLQAQDFAQHRLFSIGPLAAMQGLLLLVLLLNRFGRALDAGRLFCLGNWALVTFFLAVEEMGSHHIALLGFPVVLILSGLLLDRRFFAGITALVLTSVVGLTVAEVEGWTRNQFSQFTSYAGMFETLVILGFTAGAVVLFTGDMRRALLRSREQEARLAESKAELQRQTEALRGTARKLSTAIELAAEGVAHTDIDGRITEVNSRASEITGYTRDELLGRLFTDFFPADELARKPIRWDLLDRGEVVQMERKLSRKDGTVIVAEMTSQRLPDRTLQCFVRDITSRNAQEDAARQRQRLESLGTLAGGIAHDFNNLLTVMHGALDTIAARAEAPLELSGPLEDLRTVAERANELTRQLLAFARRQTLDRRSVDLRQTLEQNVRMLRRLLGPQIELVVAIPEQACPVFADAGALAQVFTNLAVNARDAMPKGGRLELGCRTVEIASPPVMEGREIAGGDFVLVHVADNGCGITEEVRRHMFEPFFTTKAGTHGTGLGLSVSLGIIEQHGGWIEVFSEAGRGTEFRIYLPKQGLVGPDQAAPVRPPAEAIRGTETILLVEDEEPVRRLAVGALEWCGFKVIEAATGVEALRLWAERPEAIQLLLTDVAMPGGVSGVDLAQECRRQCPTLPIMITSGYNQEEVGFGEGCWDDIRFLPKPYTMAALARMARETLDTPVIPRVQ